MKCSLGISNFLEEITSLSHSVIFLFLCIDRWGRLSYISLLLFRTLHSNGYIFPFFLFLSLLFFSQLFVRSAQTTILPFCISFSWLGFPLAQSVKNLPAVQETQVRFLGWEDPLEKELATHSSILAWKISGQRSLMHCSPWDRKELDTTEWLTLINTYLTLTCTMLWISIHHSSGNLSIRSNPLIEPCEKKFRPKIPKLIRYTHWIGWQCYLKPIQSRP